GEAKSSLFEGDTADAALDRALRNQSQRGLPSNLPVLNLIGQSQSTNHQLIEQLMHAEEKMKIAHQEDIHRHEEITMGLLAKMNEMVQEQMGMMGNEESALRDEANKKMSDLESGYGVGNMNAQQSGEERWLEMESELRTAGDREYWKHTAEYHQQEQHQGDGYDEGEEEEVTPSESPTNLGLVVARVEIRMGHHLTAVDAEEVILGPDPDVEGLNDSGHLKFKSIDVKLGVVCGSLPPPQESPLEIEVWANPESCELLRAGPAFRLLLVASRSSRALCSKSRSSAFYIWAEEGEAGEGGGFAHL
ncbi:unnamed protein product, partial [Symbiodinium microadriaticum]